MGKSVLPIVKFCAAVELVGVVVVVCVVVVCCCCLLTATHTGSSSLPVCMWISLKTSILGSVFNKAYLPALSLSTDSIIHRTLGLTC